MLLIIHNLPIDTRYADVKALIKEKCGLTEMIVDNLVVEGKSKKVTVGLADEGDAAILVRKINGLFICNKQLFVEDVRQKKTTEQPYRPSEQYSQEQRQMQFQSQTLSSQPQMPCGPSAPNFGVPFYMTAQNQNIGNNPQYVVQYPKIPGSMGNEPNEDRDTGFEQQYGGRNERPSMTPDRDSNRGRSPKRVLVWTEQDYDRSGGRDRSRDRDRSGGRRGDRQSHRDERLDDDQYRSDLFQRKSNQDYGSNKLNNSRFEKPGNRSEPLWEDPDRSPFRKQNVPYRYDDNKKYNNQGRQNQEKETQKFRDNSYSQSRGFDYASRSSDFPKKRTYESSDKNIFSPQNKKFGSNQQYQFKKQQYDSGSSSSNNYQGKKFLSRTPIQQNRPHMQPKGQYKLQKNKPQWQQKVQPQQKQFKKQENIPKNHPAPPEFKEPIENVMKRHEAWRIQASAVIATQILVNVGRMPNNRRDPLLIALKKCVRARIDVMVGDEFRLTLREILYNYRQKFHDDDVFCNTVWEKVQSREILQPDELAPGEKGTEEAVDKNMSGNKPQDHEDEPQDHGNEPQDEVIEKEPPTAQSSGNTDRLPKYPDGNKKMIRELKRTQKEEMVNESLYNLDADQDKALKEELDKFDELIRQEIAYPANEVEKSISKFMNNVIIPELRKVLTLHVKKRVLDVRSNVSVRVICQFKVPRRHVIEAFLKNYGVISLKVCDKNRLTMIAICDSYENFDALCKLDTTVIDNLRVSFKPLHLTGPPIKPKQLKQITKNMTKNNSANNESNDNVTKNKEMDDENVEKNDSTRSETQNEVNECEFNSSTESQGNIVSDSSIKLKEVIIMDENDDTSDKKDIDKPTKVDANMVHNDEGSESATVTDVGDKATVAHDDEELSQDGVIDDNIDDEDLEDF